MTDPVFETVLVEAGRIRLRDRHLARLRASGADAAIVARVAQMMDELCADPAAPPTVVRIDVHGRALRATPRAPSARTPVELVVVPGYDPADRRRERKIADRAWAVAAEAGIGPGQEAVLVSADGLAGETTRANIFALVDGVLVTPPAHGLLAGVTRGWVLELTGAVERELPADRLLAAGVAFLTTAGRGVVAVAGTDTALADELARAWDAL